jgi:hypothetical protein
VIPRFGPEVAASLFGLLWFLANGGANALHPTHLGWLMKKGDWAEHLLGWLFFRLEPWRLPLGSIRRLSYPIGTWLAYTDSIPWLSVALRTLHHLLPVDFQFIGPWLALCFILQGAFGGRLVASFSTAPLHRFLGGALFVLSPVLRTRVGHDALCAQWPLLALLGMFFCFE